MIVYRSLKSSTLLFLLGFNVGGHGAEEQAHEVCALNDKANQLASMIIEHPSQKRPVLQCNQQLAEIAQQRAEQLATNSDNPEETPNQILIKGGFRVPNYYPVSGNQVEAVARDLDLAGQVMKYFNDSGKHHDHVLGKDEFFALQSQMGVGYYQDEDPTTHVQWVVLMAEPWKSPKIVYKQNFNMPLKMATGCDQNWQNSNNEFLKSKCRKMGRTRKNEQTEVQLNCDDNSCENQ